MRDGSVVSSMAGGTTVDGSEDGDVVVASGPDEGATGGAAAIGTAAAWIAAMKSSGIVMLRPAFVTANATPVRCRRVLAWAQQPLA
jgi:hypothetical protein